MGLAVNGPRHLPRTFQSWRDEKVFFAGQLTGVQGSMSIGAPASAGAFHG